MVNLRDAEIARHAAVGRLITEAQHSTFSSYATGLSHAVEFGITGYYCPGRLWHAGIAKMPTGPVICPFIVTFCCNIR